MIPYFIFESCLESRCCCSVTQSCLTLCNPMDCSTPSPTPGVYSNSCPLSRWCHPTIWSFVAPFSSCLQSFPASGSFAMSQLFTSDGQSIGASASASASVLPMNIWVDFLQGGLVWSPCSPRDSQESSPAPQFISSVLSLLCGPTFTSIHDYWKKHRFD